MLYQHAFMPSINDIAVNFPGPGKLRTRYLWGVDQVVSELGGNPRRVFESQGVSPSAFEDPDNDIDCISAVNLLEYCSHHLRSPLFGLQLAERQDPEALGCVLALARAAPTWRQALQCLIDYVPVSISPECDLELLVDHQVVELRWLTQVGMGEREQVYYHGLLLFMKALKTLGGGRIQPCYANVPFRMQRSDIEALQERLGCRVNTRSEANGIALPAALLDQPMPTANTMLYKLLGAGMAELRIASRASLREKVEAYIRRALPQGRCSVEDCAQDLLMSTRTLQKRLTLMDVKFSDLVRCERIKLAKHALLWTDYSLDEIAFQLGYSEQTSFGRAFKQSVGLTPKEFRQAERRNQAELQN